MVKESNFLGETKMCKSREACVNCLEPIETVENGIVVGYIDLNEDGLCDDCAGRKEKAMIDAHDFLHGDFDYSMNA